MKQIKFEIPFYTESGEVINDLVVGYHTFGTLNENQSNVIWVCHALTANSDVSDWWAGAFGAGLPLDPEKYFIVCANVIGSCYGSTGPLSIKSDNVAYYHDYPNVTTRDMVNVHRLLAEKLEIKRIKCIIGASLGGQQVLEWNALEPQRFEQAVFIATNAQHSAIGQAWNETQRMAIYNDVTFSTKSENAGKSGLATARAIAMISYRSYAGYALTQTDTHQDKLTDFKAASYQRYQGQKLANRFNAFSYVTLSKAMDSHNLGRGRGEIINVLNTFKARSLVVAISSDTLFPPSEQQFLARHIPNASYQEIHSDFGHDGFLVEFEQLNNILNQFLSNRKGGIPLTTFKQKQNA